MLPAYLDHLPQQLPEDLKLTDYRIESFTAGVGVKQCLYRLGKSDGPQMVLLPPYGMSFILMTRLAALLAQRFNLLIWESAGCPDGNCHVTDSNFSLSAQSHNLSSILKKLHIRDFHFVGWCQAAQLIVHAIKEQLVQPNTMTWIGPAGFGMALVKSEFERCALPIYLEIERRGPDEAAKLAKILDKYQGKVTSEGVTGEQLTMLHLKDPGVTRVFSKYMKCFEDNKALAKSSLEAALSSTPTQIIHCRDDTFSHYSEAVQIAKRFTDVRLHLLNDGGHLQVFENPEIPANLIFSFIRECGSDHSEVFECKSQTISV